jgi:hypothetical protein
MTVFDEEFFMAIPEITQKLLAAKKARGLLLLT